jgi:hypothetical protein
MVEEAVEEVLELVRRAAPTFKASPEPDEFDILMHEGATPFLRVSSFLERFEFQSGKRRRLLVVEVTR